jgi:hypothetical protein
LSRRKSAASFIEDMQSSVTERGAASESTRCSSARPGSICCARSESAGGMYDFAVSENLSIVEGAPPSVPEPTGTCCSRS